MKVGDLIRHKDYLMLHPLDPDFEFESQVYLVVGFTNEFPLGKELRCITLLGGREQVIKMTKRYVVDNYEVIS